MIPKRQLRFFAVRDELWGDTIELRICVKTDAGEIVGVAQPVQFVARNPEDDGQRSQPCMVMGRDSAQRLMDELWNVGLRPTEGTGSAGSLAATERHLNDMRALVFIKPILP